LGEKVAPFAFTKKNDLFIKVKYMEQGITKSKSDGELGKVKDSTIIDCGSFRPSSPCINFKAAVAGTFSPCRYEGTSYDEKVRRRVTMPDKLLPLPRQVKVWVT
jgi:hypothetical protein